MKSSIHPTYYQDAQVTCACGNTFTTGSTLKEIKVDICSACHPFFTGEMRLVDTQGRIEKFEAKRSQASKTPSKKKKQVVTKDDRPRTLKEMLKTEQTAEDQEAPKQKNTSKDKK